MKRLSTLAALGFLFALTSPATAGVPGDVGTQACGDVQSDAQDAVSSGGPYKNHGQLVSTAAKVVDPAKTSGEITAECASCIMNQFARKIPIKDQKTCGPDLCAAPGAPGWQNEIRVGGNGVLTADTTAQACCQACVDNLDCAQWAFVGGTICSHNIGVVCVAPTPTPFVDGGIIRCP
jgi:hypothetical protein